MKIVSRYFAGGPLMLKQASVLTQVGISSSHGLNPNCGNGDFPPVFTRVSEVACWVAETVCRRKNELCGLCPSEARTKSTSPSMSSSPSISARPSASVSYLFLMIIFYLSTCQCNQI
jgi:secreted trypsin-like serine protease